MTKQDWNRYSIAHNYTITNIGNQGGEYTDFTCNVVRSFNVYYPIDLRW